LASVSTLTGGLASAASAASTGVPGYAIKAINVPPGAFGVAVDEPTNMVYSIEASDENLSVINGATDTVTAPVQLGIYPAFTGVVVNPATDMIYVDGVVAGSKTGASVVKVISGVTDTVVATIALPAGSSPGGMAVNPATGTVYVTENTQSAIAVVDGPTNKVTTTVSLGYHTWPYAVAVDSSTNMVYVTDGNTDALSVVDGATNALTDNVALPGVPGANGPYSVVVDADTNTVVVSTSLGLIRVDGNSDAITGDLVGAGDGFGLALDATANAVLASPGGSFTSVINLSSLKVTGSIPVGGDALAVDSSTGTKYIASGTVGVDLVAVTDGISPTITSAGSVTVIAGRSGSFAVTATGTPASVFAETGSLPRGVSFSPSGVLSGTPWSSSGGRYRITITAANTVMPAAVQAMTLTVDQAPSITSARHAVFRIGHRNSFTVVTRGYPAVTLRESGRLARGIRFVVHANGTATLTGTPRDVAAGKHFVFRIVAWNGIGKTVIQRFTLIMK
jgi:large repetitive protein